VIGVDAARHFIEITRLLRSRLLLCIACFISCTGGGVSGFPAGSDPAVTPVRSAVLPWTGCFLAEPPPGACGEAWGPTDSSCDPDRFLDRSAFRYVPDRAPPEFPLSTPLPVQWHIFLHADASGDVLDEALEAQLTRVNVLFEPAGFSLATAAVHRYRRAELSGCRVKVTPELLTDPHYPVCGAGSPYREGLDPETNINIYVVDLEGPTAFAFDPCIFPPGDSRDGLYLNREVLTGTDRAVVAHELGHYFGLLHTFHTWRWGEDRPDPVCADIDNDFVRDTLPQRSYLTLRDVDCDNPPTTCAGSDQPDLITNIMQYSACLTGGNGSFTPGQLRRMQWTLVQQRPGLLGAN